MGTYTKFENVENQKLILKFLETKPLGASLHEIKSFMLEQGINLTSSNLSQRIAFLKNKRFIQHIGASRYRILGIEKARKKMGRKPKEYFNPLEPLFIF